MESAGDKKQTTRIQMKHIFIAVIVIVSTLSLIASIVMITIGYLNPFGTVGLGILGGGCVLYFSAILFLCAGSMWVKNRYYADENDFGEKWSPSSSEDISLLKPTLTSPAKYEAGYITETGRQSDTNMVPLCSVSTVFSSVSSSVSTVPERSMLFNWQGGDAEGALDCDVFSSSLTAMQHTDMKLQEKLKLKRGSTEQINSDSSECKIKDVEKAKIAELPMLHSNGKSVSDTPRQRKPVVMDIEGTKEKQLVNYHISDQSKGENNTNPNSQICGRNNMSNMLCPVKGIPSSAAQSKYHQHMAEQSKAMYERKAKNELPKKYNQDCKPALEKRIIHTGEKDNQTSDRRWCVISETDYLTHSSRLQGTTSKGLATVPAAISETVKKHGSCEQLHKISQESTEVPLQNLPPRLDQSEKVQLSAQMATSEHLRTKGKFMMKPGTKNGF